MDNGEQSGPEADAIWHTLSPDEKWQLIATGEAGWISALRRVNSELANRLSVPLPENPVRLGAEIRRDCASVDQTCAAHRTLQSWLEMGHEQERSVIGRDLDAATDLIAAAVERWMRGARHIMAHLAVDSLPQDRPDGRRDQLLSDWYAVGESVYRSVTQCLSQIDQHHGFPDARRELGHLFAMLVWFAEAFPALARK